MAVRKTAKGLALKRWFKEDWRTPSGKKDYSGGENTFRPTKRVSKKTPKRWSQLSEADKNNAKNEKNTTGRVSRYKVGGAWTRKEGKNPSGGLNAKGRASLKAQGKDIKAPSKKKGNKRRSSFCSRMCGMKKRLTSAKTARDPQSRINKSLRAWNCGSCSNW
tara:strand:- start:387 stop:872 length:486 start_codon:yes stop_codon:yes gene_type:complete